MGKIVSYLITTNNQYDITFTSPVLQLATTVFYEGLWLIEYPFASPSFRYNDRHFSSRIYLN